MRHTVCRRHMGVAYDCLELLKKNEVYDTSELGTRCENNVNMYTEARVRGRTEGQLQTDTAV